MSRQHWEVVGGTDSGGILVRVGQDLASEKAPDRLATGSLLEELKLDGGRLQYRRLTGKGPEQGWVSIKIGQKDLVVRANKLPAAPAKPAAATKAAGTSQTTAWQSAPAPSGLYPAWLKPVQPATAADKPQPAQVPAKKGELSEQAQIELARERVKHVCKLHGLRLFPVEADGNCQFRALAHEFFGDQNLHVRMREKIVAFLLRHKSRYGNSEMLEGHTMEEYCAKMLRGTRDKITGKLRPTWGDFLTLQAACDMEGVPISILNNHPSMPIKTFDPRAQKTNRPIVLAYILSLHYDATMPDPEAESYFGDENTELFSKYHRLEELS